MLEAGNGFDILKGSLKSNLKKLYRKVESVNKKLSTLENSKIGPSVVFPPVLPSLNMQALGGIDVADLFYQVQMFFT